VIWACPLAFEFLGLFCFLTFSRLYHLSWSLKFHLPPVWGCDPSRDFLWKKNYSSSKRDRKGCTYFRMWRNNKDDLSSFQAQATMINKLWPHLVWWFGLCKDAFHESWATSSLHTIIHTFKNTCFKSHGVRVFIHFFSYSLVYNLVTSMMELLDSLVILQVECQKYCFWINIKSFLKLKCQINFFKTPIGKLILVKEMNCVYEITRDFQNVFMSSYKKTLLRIMLGRKHDWMTNLLFHWNFGKEV
jgi:hypothetical protein